MSPRALDANILLRFVTADHPEMSPRCRALLEQVQLGEERVFLPEAALADVAWTLKSHYKWPVARICDFLGDLLALSGVEMHRKAMVWDALDLFERGKLDFSDALIAAEMAEHALTEIYSYDHDFDHLPGVKRVEP